MTRLSRRAAVAPVLVSVFATALFPPAVSARAFMGSAALSDRELAAEFGKFLAPDGTEIALSIQMDTRVDGQLVLRSILTPDAAAPDRLQLFAQPNESAESDPSGWSVEPDSNPMEGAVEFTFARGAGLTMVSDAADPMPQIQVAVNGATERPDSSDLQRLNVDAAGNASTPAGPVNVVQNSQGAIVTLAADALLVKHVLGSTVANVAANTADNRIVESATTVNLSLANAAPLLVGSSLFNIDDAVLSVARRPAF